MTEINDLDKYLSSFGFELDFLIDVGVHEGTPWLYDAFPTKHFLLVDPMKDFESKLLDIPKRYTINQIALGEKAAVAHFTEDGGRSSLYQINPFDAPQHSKTESQASCSYTVDVIDLDSFLDRQEMHGKFGLKIDAEGAELAILMGGRTAISARCEFVILELSLLQRFVDGEPFSQYIQYMAELGFELYNILDNWQPRPKFYNILFLRSDTNLVNLRYTENSPSSFISLSDQAMENGDVDLAAEYAIKAYEIAPNAPDIAFKHAKSLEKLGDENEAIKVYRRTIAYAPGDYKAYYHLAGILNRQGQLGEAYDLALSSLSLTNSAPICIFLIAKVLLKMEKYDQALDWYLQLIDNNPKDHRGYLDGGLCLEKMGENEKAQDLYHKGLQHLPDHNLLKSRLRSEAVKKPAPGSSSEF